MFSIFPPMRASLRATMPHGGFDCPPLTHPPLGRATEDGQEWLRRVTSSNLHPIDSESGSGFGFANTEIGRLTPKGQTPPVGKW
jgi:hypothetical protein